MKFLSLAMTLNGLSRSPFYKAKCDEVVKRVLGLGYADIYDMVDAMGANNGIYFLRGMITNIVLQKYPNA